MRANRIAEFRAFLKYNHRRKTESGILMEKSEIKSVTVLKSSTQGREGVRGLIFENSDISNRSVKILPRLQ
jgi:hypothetical protein